MGKAGETYHGGGERCKAAVFAAMRDMSIFSRLPVVPEIEEKDSFGPAGSLPSTRFRGLRHPFFRLLSLERIA